MSNNSLFISALAMLLSLVTACGGGGGTSEPPPRPTQQVNILVSWNANRETAVNTNGGGYRVYYATTAGLALTDPAVTMTDVPYISGSTVPTSTTLSVQSGNRYYFKVTAYSALNRVGQSGGTESQPSSFSLNVP
ncbi:MAG TPA: hypothetical protein ENI64_05400 [Gammaproteobacteria bacterium]|nr:hypothetical protein [Gammaproteobacteria bacterium]